MVTEPELVQPEHRPLTVARRAAGDGTQLVAQRLRPPAVPLEVPGAELTLDPSDDGVDVERVRVRQDVRVEVVPAALLVQRPQRGPGRSLPPGPG